MKVRPPEIVEDFDRDIYGRVPANTPKVTWEITNTTEEIKADGWVDAKGMFFAAGLVYKLLGKKDMGPPKYHPSKPL